MKEPLNEEAFIQQYVLARAAMPRTAVFNAVGAVDRGKEAYDRIKIITKNKDQQ